MNKEDRFEKIWIDLRPFGWGIRQVDVIWPDGHDGGAPGPDSVGTEQIKNAGVHHEDLGPDVEAGDGDIDSIFDQNAQDADAGRGGGEDTGDGEGPAAETPEPVVAGEGD